VADVNSSPVESSLREPRALRRRYQSVDDTIVQYSAFTRCRNSVRIRNESDIRNRHFVQQRTP
jgi:hypothetical protein